MSRTPRYVLQCVAWRLLAVAVPCFCVQSHHAAAEGCPDSSQDIATDRPDVTNSSLVVPTGSLQAENGVNWVAHRGVGTLDGSNTRLRLGIARCSEFLVDLPSFTSRLYGRGPIGFSDLAPAIKHQIEGLPIGTSLSAVIGVGLPTGATRIAGRGYSPYLQFPWSREIGEAWSINGMVTAFWFPEERPATTTVETTLAVEREIGPRADLFVEYVGDYRTHGDATQMLNFGGAYRLTPTEQIDFHIGFGLNEISPKYFLGLGYSYRFDRLW